MQNVKLKLKLLEKNIMHLKRFNRIQEIVNQITTFSLINESLRSQFYDPKAHTAAVALLRSSYNELAIALITEAQDCTNLFLDPSEDVTAEVIETNGKLAIEFSQLNNVVYVYSDENESIASTVQCSLEAIKNFEKVCNVKVVKLDGIIDGVTMKQAVIAKWQEQGG